MYTYRYTLYFLRNKGKGKIVFSDSSRSLFQIFDPREEMATLVALVIIWLFEIIFQKTQLDVSDLISVNVLSNTLEFKLCFALYKNFKTWKIFIQQTFKAFISLINGFEYYKLHARHAFASSKFYQVQFYSEICVNHEHAHENCWNIRKFEPS